MPGKVYRFPLDVENAPYGHYMKITAYNRQTQAQQVIGGITGARPALDQAGDTFIFFIPGGPTNGQSMIWQQGHEYTDVKLTRLFTSALGVVGDLLAGGATLLGYPMNPRVDVLFRNTNLREYQFMFMLAPQSKEESNVLFGLDNEPQTGMLNRLRYNAAPVLNDNTYDSPNEFEIKFYFVNERGAVQENKKIPKIARGVIKRVDIDMTPNGDWSTFYDGSPVSALLTFTFLETKIIDKKYIDQGY